jgi:hypothetical protein
MSCLSELDGPLSIDGTWSIWLNLALVAEGLVAMGLSAAARSELPLRKPHATVVRGSGVRV